MEGKHDLNLLGAICTSENRHTSYRESETGVNRKKWNETGKQNTDWGSINLLMAEKLAYR